MKSVGSAWTMAVKSFEIKSDYSSSDVVTGAS
jgi:hypothetical protein